MLHERIDTDTGDVEKRLDYVTNERNRHNPMEGGSVRTGKLLAGAAQSEVHRQECVSCVRRNQCGQS